ncbi:unnamed protein product [Toxocara canis]|uniref:Protein RFT1 homolog n=1 Tax=Toxocara canis TaxID=6265 RepID=A0A3P7H2N1_TOXCA|nr:unnamed protein product [Toxocara canis]
MSRIISFAINMYLLRRIDGDLLGVVNVRYPDIVLHNDHFLGVPPRVFRLAKVRFSSMPKPFVFSPLVCPLVALLLYLAVWMPFSTNPPLELVPSYGWALFAFGFAAWLEALAEPFVIVSLKFTMDTQYAIVQGLLVVMQRVVVIALLLLTSMPHIVVFCYAHDLSVLGTFAVHSAFKQILTDGTGYVLTFTERFTLSDKAVFDAVDKLGSLIARIVLAPLEHSAYLFFSANLRRDVAVDRQAQEVVKVAVDALNGLLHLTTVVGIVVCVFAVPYSPLAVSIYGGDLLSKNSGASILRLYCVYIVVIAINGITECFAMATMNNKQIFGGTPGIMHSAAHIATGGALLLFVMNHVYQSDVQLTKFISQQFNLAHVSVE